MEVIAVREGDTFNHWAHCLFLSVNIYKFGKILQATTLFYNFNDKCGIIRANFKAFSKDTSVFLEFLYFTLFYLIDLHSFYIFELVKVLNDGLLSFYSSITNCLCDKLIKMLRFDLWKLAKVLLDHWEQRTIHLKVELFFLN